MGVVDAGAAVVGMDSGKWRVGKRLGQRVAEWRLGIQWVKERKRGTLSHPSHSNQMVFCLRSRSNTIQLTRMDYAMKSLSLLYPKSLSR